MPSFPLSANFRPVLYSVLGIDSIDEMVSLSGPAFGIEDQAITHAIFITGLDIDVFTYDAGRLFPETLEVWGTTEQHYGRRIRGLSPDRDSIERLIEPDGVNGFR